MLIGLTGEATVGKDEFADKLVEDHGFVKLGWADPLYKMALTLDPLLQVRFWDMLANRWLFPMQRLSHIVGTLGWTKAKRIPSVRHYLQALGTEAVRENLGEDAWIAATTPVILKHMRAGRHVVITNVRFANEAERIIALGGHVVRIKRDGVKPVNDHASDAGLAFGFATEVVDNSGSLDFLRMEAARVFESLNTPFEGLDHDAMIRRWSTFVCRATNFGVEAILKCVKPTDLRLRDFIDDNEVHLQTSSSWPVEVLVGGEKVGEVNFDDKVLTVTAFLV